MATIVEQYSNGRKARCVGVINRPVGGGRGRFPCGVRWDCIYGIFSCGPMLINANHSPCAANSYHLDQQTVQTRSRSWRAADVEDYSIVNEPFRLFRHRERQVCTELSLILLCNIALVLSSLSADADSCMLQRIPGQCRWQIPPTYA